MKKEINIYKLDSIASTNSYASKLLKKEDLADGTVIWAVKQTGGKGMGSNKWESQAGKNLTISIIFRPRFLDPGMQFGMLRAVALGVRDLIRLYTKEVSIKWPNDIYVGDKKIAGILIENSFKGNKFEHCIAGIGININQDKFPAHIPNPGSLKQETGKETKPESLLWMLLDSVMEHYENLKKGENDSLEENYHESLYLLDTEHNFTDAAGKYSEKPGTKFSGKIKGVLPTGELLVETTKGEDRKYGFKQIEY